MSWHSRWGTLTQKIPTLRRMKKRGREVKSEIRLPKKEFKDACKAFYTAGIIDGARGQVSPDNQASVLMEKVFGGHVYHNNTKRDFILLAVMLIALMFLGTAIAIGVDMVKLKAEYRDRTNKLTEIHLKKQALSEEAHNRLTQAMLEDMTPRLELMLDEPLVDTPLIEEE